jgi:hypothetical protein
MPNNLPKEIYWRNSTLNALNISVTINAGSSLTMMMGYASIVDSISLVALRNNTVNSYTPKNNTFFNYKLKKTKVYYRPV